MDMREFFQKRICVAISGGIDSVVLLRYLKTFEREDGYILSAVHCEHGIRGEESVEDMRFVEALCKEWGVPLTTFSADCPARAKAEKASLETAARSFRYESFAKLIEEDKTDFIALAHHANDDVETVLFRLSRGASLTGAGGMSERNGYLLRPLLSWTREQIVEYAKAQGLSWREDQTNFKRDATRNRLRLDVLPKLEEAVPGAANNLARFASLAQEDDRLLYEYASALFTTTDEGGMVAFSDKKPLFRRACLLALKSLGVEKDYTALHLENAYRLQSLERGAKMTFPKGVEAERREQGVLFYRKKPLAQEVKAEEKLFDGSNFDGGRYLASVSKTPPAHTKNVWKVLKLDGEKLPQGTVFRFREEGDFIRRFGGGKKSLKKFFNEKKIPVSERAYLPVLAKEDEVLVVCGVEISERVKITADTKEILYITIEEGNKNEE